MFRPPLLLLAICLAACGGSETTAPEATNRPPAIIAVTASPAEVVIGEASTLAVEAADPDGDPLSFRWDALRGTLLGSGRRIVYATSTCCAGVEEVLVWVSDGRGGEARGMVTVRVR